MLQIAEREGLEIVEMKREAHSAEDMAQRPAFNEMISDIKAGKYNGILAWHPDRHSRHAGDLGSLVDLMDQQKLVEVRTFGQRFSNSSSENFLLMILCSQAKLENDNKSINVKRGLRTRVEMGLWPSQAPTGYLSHPDRNMKCHVIVDPERSEVIKQIFDKLLYEGMSGRDIYQWFKAIDFKSRNGKLLTLSKIYILLRNPFYCEIVEYLKRSGKWYAGQHEPLISQTDFLAAQKILDRQRGNRLNKHEFAFNKFLKCGYCRSGISGDLKKKLALDGRELRYTYYKCTKFYDKRCKNPAITEKLLIQLLIQNLSKIQFCFSNEAV